MAAKFRLDVVDVVVVKRTESEEIGSVLDNLTIGATLDSTDDLSPKTVSIFMMQTELEGRMVDRDVDKPWCVTVKNLRNQGVFVRPPVSILKDTYFGCGRRTGKPGGVDSKQDDIGSPVYETAVGDLKTVKYMAKCVWGRSRRISKMDCDRRVGWRERGWQGGVDELESIRKNILILVDR